MYDLKVMGVKTTILWYGMCINWQYDKNLLRIHVKNDDCDVIHVIGIPLHNIEMIESYTKLEKKEV